MKALAPLIVFGAAAFGPCTRVTPPVTPPLPPRVDTVLVTREVAPPLPEGTPAIICLSSGYPMPVLIAANGDTLIGEKRIRVQDLRPGLVFEGTYATDKDWLARGELRFEKRVYKKSGEPLAAKCEDLKDIGELEGVRLFAFVDAPSPVETLFVPVRPGVFQPFRTVLPRRR